MDEQTTEFLLGIFLGAIGAILILIGRRLTNMAVTKMGKKATGSVTKIDHSQGLKVFPVTAKAAPKKTLRK